MAVSPMLKNKAELGDKVDSSWEGWMLGYGDLRRYLRRQCMKEVRVNHEAILGKSVPGRAEPVQRS